MFAQRPWHKTIRIPKPDRESVVRHKKPSVIAMQELGKKSNSNRNLSKSHWPLDTFLNTLRPRQNGRHFADAIFKCIFLNENVSIAIKISLKFVPKGPINNIPALVQIMAWRRPSHNLNQWWSVYRRIYASLGLNELNHLSLDKMATISHMTFSNAFSLTKIFVIWLKFHWSLFLGV